MLEGIGHLISVRRDRALISVRKDRAFDQC